VISFGPTSAADALPPAVMHADPAETAATEGAGAFGNVLEQLMGTAPRKGAGVDLPLEDEGQLAEDAELDELVNANVVDPGVQPINRLALAPTWALADASATSVAVDAAVDSTVEERSVSAPTGMSQLPGSVDVPASAADAASSFAALMPEAGDETTPKLPAEPPVSASTASALEAAVPPPAAAGTNVVPAPESGVRDQLPASRKTDKADKTDKQDQARAAFRVTTEAGHRAYAAAASEGSAKDSTQHGLSDARSNAADAGESAASANSPAMPFQVVAERPSPSAAGTLATSIASAEAVEAAVATELPAQVVQSIRMQAMDGGGEAIVRLNPEYLGELVVAVKVEHGAVSAALQSDVPAVRKWVENNEASLRQALADHGLQLERLTVSGDAPQAENGEREARREDPREEESQPESRRQRKNAPDATFEVVV
jgi:flagellar hook-length control protein FliK